MREKKIVSERERERERTMFTKMGEERKNRFSTSGL